MPLTDHLPRWLVGEARAKPSTELVPANGTPAPGVLPNRTGFVQGIPREGFGADAAEAQIGAAQNTTRSEWLQCLWEEYLRCPWAWACVNAISRTVTAGGIVMRWDGDDGQGDQKQPPKPATVLAFERLISYTNPIQDIRQLMRNAVADLQVFGGAMVEVVWFAGIPVALYNQDFPTTIPDADPHGNVKGYKQITEDGRTATFKPEQIIHITLDSARPAVFGISPTHAAEESIVAWMFLHACEKEAARRGLPPNIHADLPAGTPDTEVTKWQNQHATRNLGPSSVGTPITTKGGGKITELATARLADILSAKNSARGEIISAYGVPPAKVGIIESGNLGGGTGSDQNKALDLMTMIPTPAGWTTMGELKPGDQVLDENGKPCNVVSTHEVPDGSSWRLHFSDGTYLDCDLDHLWVTWTWPDRKAYGRAMGTTDPNGIPENWPQWRSGRGLGPQVRRTEDVIATLRRPSDGAPNHSIPLTRALELPEADLPLDPYVLGAWLGDGTTVHGAITVADDDVQTLREIRAAGFKVTERPSARKYNNFRNAGYYSIHGLPGVLRGMGLLGNKRVPAPYLRASAAQRLALLQGLMDTDGGWGGEGQVVFVSSLEHLADAAMELARSLGQKPAKAKRRVVIKGIEYTPSFRVTWTPTVQPFRLARKADRFQRTAARHAGMRAMQRMIVGAEKIADRPMRCIKVDSPNHMYLAGDGMIPTHNTFWLDVINPTAQLIAEKLQFALAVQGFGVSGWHAEFAGVDYRDDQTIENIRDMRLRNGSWILNRYRADIGEPPVEGGDDAVLVARQDIVLWADMQARSAASVAAIAAVDSAGSGDSGPPPAAGTGRPPSQGGARDPQPPSESAVIAEAVVASLRASGVLEHTAKLDARQRVYNQLLKSFPPSAIKWVLDPDVVWSGPVNVAPSQIDMDDKDEWQATKDKAKVARIKRRHKATGRMKPIVLVRPPGADRDLIADGRHHLLAAEDLGIPVKAYVAHVPSKRGPWSTLSARQRRNEKAHESASGRLSKDEANYGPSTSPEVRCGTCVMWDDGRCSLVQGDIAIDAVCSQWQAEGASGAGAA